MVRIPERRPSSVTVLQRNSSVSHRDDLVLWLVTLRLQEVQKIPQLL